MEPPKIEILSTRQITSEKWLNLYESAFRKDGKTSKWGFVSRRRGDGNSCISTTFPNAVVTVPILVMPNGERKLVLIKEYRVPIETYEYHFTAGLLEKGETIENCVKRELKEEAGFDLLKINRISPIMPSSSGMTDETSVMVFADCTYGDGKQELEHSEDIEVILLNHAEVCEWAKKDLMYAAKTWPVLLLFEQIGSLEMRQT